MAATRQSRWSWSLGTVYGIEIRVHATLYALLVAIGVAAPMAGLGVAQVAAQAALVVGVFACVLVHELAHALVARRFGCRTREILLLPIGGIAQMERIPERPAQELLVALVGPLTNVVLAVAFGGVIALAGWPIGPEQPSLLGAIVVPMFWINISLAAFNLLPAFPMDGGRVLRAGLAIKLGRPRATRIAASVGKVLAVVFVLVGLTQGAWMLALVGVFVWFTAEREAASMAFEAALAHGTVADAMHHDVPVVDPSLPLDAVLAPLERDGVVFVRDHDQIVGVLTSDQLAAFVAQHHEPSDTVSPKSGTRTFHPKAS